MIITDKQIRDSILECVVQYKTFTGGEILKHLYDEPGASQMFIDQTIRRIHTTIRSIVKWSPLGLQYKYTAAFSKSEVTMRPAFKPRLIIEALDQHGKQTSFVYRDTTEAQAAFNQFREGREMRSDSMLLAVSEHRLANLSVVSNPHKDRAQQLAAIFDLEIAWDKLLNSEFIYYITFVIASVFP